MYSLQMALLLILEATMLSCHHYSSREELYSMSFSVVELLSLLLEQVD